MLNSDYNVLRWTTLFSTAIAKLYNCFDPPFLMKAFTTIISKHTIYPCVRFSDEGSYLKFIKMKATPFLSFSCSILFLWLQKLWYPGSKETYKTHAAYRLAPTHSTFSSNWQFELKVTTALSRFKKVIFWHACRKTAVVWAKLPLQSSSLQPQKCNVDKPT